MGTAAGFTVAGPGHRGVAAIRPIGARLTEPAAKAIEANCMAVDHASMSDSDAAFVRRGREERYAWKSTPRMIWAATIAATVMSTAKQKGGHQRVPRTNWWRCCQRSFAPWAR
jgi:hypothetical protein